MSRLLLRGVIAAVLLIAIAAPATATPTTAVTNTQVNAAFNGPFPTNKQNEPSLAMDPNNSAHLVAGSNDEIQEPPCTNTSPSSCAFVPGVQGSGFYASFDGGHTWPCQGVVDLSGQRAQSDGDPQQSFDSRGNVYYGQLSAPFPPTHAEVNTGLAADVFVAKSTDGGCSYSTAARVSGNAPAIFDDKPGLAADASPTSPFRDNVYVSWSKFSGLGNSGKGNSFGSVQIVFSRSTDGGNTWSGPKPLSPAHNNNAAGGRQGSQIGVAPDGTVYVVWTDVVNKQSVERMAISHDGGASFGQSLVIAPAPSEGPPALPGSSFRISPTFPSISVGADGSVYVAWTNYLNGHGTVQLVHSTDGGMNWSAPVTAGDVSGRSAYFAAVTARPTAGHVAIIFNALDDVAAGTPPGAGVTHFDAYVARSTDFGQTFEAPIVLSTASSDPDASSANSLTSQFLGDYVSAASDGTHVYGIWTDTRNGSTCAAVDEFRAGTAPKPNVIAQCPTTFGNSDIYLGTFNG
jgi:hypothetical protein